MEMGICVDSYVSYRGIPLYCGCGHGMSSIIARQHLQLLLVAIAKLIKSTSEWLICLSKAG